MSESTAGVAYGTATRISAHVRRITAPNPSFMTASGTNTYLIGDAQVAVVDPGPAIDSHIEAIQSAAADAIAVVAVTHTHPDHSPAALALAAATGARRLGNPLEADDGFQDTTFVSDRIFAHDEVHELGGCRVRALHTPGHVSNHYCLLVEEDGVLLTGDHMMQGSTVVIIPPHGDMGDYMRSMEMLLDYDIRLIGPGHGDPIEEPIAEMRRVLEHRRRREEKIHAALRRMGKADLDELLPLAYDDIDASRHMMAKMSLWAHLIKLREEGIIAVDGDIDAAGGGTRWQAL